MVVPWTGLLGPHMGHIKRIRFKQQSGPFVLESEIEGSMTSQDFADLMRLSKDPSLAESENDDSELEPEKAEDVEPKEFEAAANLAEGILEAQEGLIDAARGAAGLLCDRFGIEHGPKSQAHKLIKQVMGRVVEVSDIYGRMTFELANLRGALVRLGFADAPASDPTQPADKYCAQLGHHIDLAKRQGVTLTQPTSTEGLEPTRDERMAQLKALFQSSQRAILDMAVVDGYVKEGMDPKKAMAEAMRWAADHSVIETGERKEAEPEVKEPLFTGHGPEAQDIADQMNKAMAAAKPPDVDADDPRQKTQARRRGESEQGQPQRPAQKEVDAKKLADRMERDGGDADDDRTP